MSSASRLTAALSAAMILNMTGFLAPAAVLPQILDDWHLGEAAGGWLTGAVFGGYALSAPVLSSLTDRIDPRRVVLLAMAVGCLAGLGMAYVAEGLWSGVFFRLLAGFGLAGIYMPGLKILADQLEGEARMNATAFFPSMFAVGSAAGFLIAALLQGWAPWTWLFAVSGVGSALAFLSVLLFVPPARPAAAARGVAVDLVLRNRGVLVYTAASLGHTIEIMGVRGWLVAAMFFAASLPENAAFADWNMPLAVTLVSVFPPMASFWLARRAAGERRRRLVITASLTSTAIALALAFAVQGPFLLFYAVIFLWAISSFSDTATLSGGIVEHAPAQVRGTALAFYALVTFTGGMSGPFLVGLVIESHGGRTVPEAWTAGLLVAVVGALLPALVLGLARK